MQQIFKSAIKFSGKMSSMVSKQKSGLLGINLNLLSYAHLGPRPISNATVVNEKNLYESGVITKIKPSEQGPLLFVSYESSGAAEKKQELQVKVAGVHIDGNGFSWLQMLTTGKEIKFSPFTIDENECIAKVLLVEENKEDLDIGRALVGLGFARAVPFKKLINSEVGAARIEKYAKQLKSSELRAKTWRKGQWSFMRESWLRWKVRTSIEYVLFSIKPLDMKIPALIR